MFSVCHCHTKAHTKKEAKTFKTNLIFTNFLIYILGIQNIPGKCSQFRNMCNENWKKNLFNYGNIIFPYDFQQSKSAVTKIAER